MFARLHNICVDELQKQNPNWKADRVFEEARLIVMSAIKQINYAEVNFRLRCSHRLKKHFSIFQFWLVQPKSKWLKNWKSQKLIDDQEEQDSQKNQMDQQVEAEPTEFTLHQLMTIHRSDKNSWLLLTGEYRLLTMLKLNIIIKIRTCYGSRQDCQC